jgi:hypothetical protein
MEARVGDAYFTITYGDGALLRLNWQGSLIHLAAILVSPSAVDSVLGSVDISRICHSSISREKPSNVNMA